MSNLPPGDGQEKSKTGKYPAWLIKTGLVASVLPFLGFGAFMVGRLLRMTHGRNIKLVVPFILFVVLFCALPAVQVFLALRKMKSPALPVPVKNLRFDPLAHIEIQEVAGGREFFFPALRAPGTAFFVMMLALFWAAMVWVLFYVKTPPLLPVLLGIVGALVIFGCVNKWYTQSRVTINPKGMRAVSRRLIFDSTRSYDAVEIAGFDNEPGIGIGLRVYYRLQVVLRNKRKITIARRIRGKPGADWLAREMGRALGRAV